MLSIVYDEALTLPDEEFAIRRRRDKGEAGRRRARPDDYDARALPGNAVEKLREISRRCRAGEPIDANLLQWLGGALAAFLEQNSASLEEAMGLRYGRGGMPWWREEATRRRDTALRKVADIFFADLGICARSREIAVLARRYAASTWRFDSAQDEMPPIYRGTPREGLWDAFKSGAAMPLGERQIRNIVG